MIRLEPKEKTEKISPEYSERHEFIRKLAAKVREDDDDREVWKNKMITASNARLGIRRQTNRPWPGYREVPIPLTDKNIRKTKSTYVSVATQMRNPIAVTPEHGVTQPQGPEAARQSAQKIAKALNGLLKKRDFKWRKKITLFVDYFLENGIAFFKVIEKFKTDSINRTLDLKLLFRDDAEVLRKVREMSNDELIAIISQREGLDPNDRDDIRILNDILKQFRQGKTRIKFTKKVVSSEPTIIPERGLNVIVPNGATEVQTAPRLTHDMWVSLQFLKDGAREGIFDKAQVEELDINQSMRDDRLTTLTQARNEGIGTERGQSELFNLREVLFWYKDSKWVASYVENPSTKGKKPGKDVSIMILRESRYPYEHGLWSWVKHDHELKSTRWHASRGIPEQIRGLQQLTDRMLNNRLIRDEINNNPMVRVDPEVAGRMGGNEIRFKPGQGLIAGAGQVEIFNRNASVDLSSERLEQQAKAYTEEYVGNPDFTINSAVSPGGARTKGEIQIAQANANRLIGTDVALFLETLSELSHMLYLLLREIVQTPVSVGGVLLTPDDFLTRVNVAWSGSVEATDVAFQMQKSLQRLDILFRYAAPAGLMSQDNIYSAIRDFLEKDPDIDEVNEFITKPLERQISEAEDQQLDIMRMKNGFDVQVRPDENHTLRIDITEAYINDPRNKALLRDPAFLERLRANIAIHAEAERILMGAPKSNSRLREVTQSSIAGGGGNGQAR